MNPETEQAPTIRTYHSDSHWCLKCNACPPTTLVFDDEAHTLTKTCSAGHVRTTSTLEDPNGPGWHDTGRPDVIGR